MKKSNWALIVAISTIAQHAGAAGFIEDSKITLGLRNYYINTDNRDLPSSPRANSQNKNAEWGQGFDLRFISGYTPGTVQFGLDTMVLYGLRLDSSPAEHGNYTGSASGGTVFPSDGNTAVDDFASLGLTGKIKISKTELKIGTLQPNNLVIRTNDTRLLPQTFQGGQITSNDIPDLTLTAGKIEHAKGRNSSNTEGLSIAGANGNSNYATGTFVNQFYYAGADYALTKSLVGSYYHAELEDFYKQDVFGLVHNWGVGGGTLKSDLRYYRSRDNGANADTPSYYTTGYYGNNVTKGKVDNNLYSYLGLYSIAGHTFGAGYEYTQGASDFPFLNQGDGATNGIITDVQIQRFAHANEHSWQLRYGYDFAKLNLPGLTANMTYLKGTHIETPTGNYSEWERDLTLTYVIPEGPFKNLGFIWRNAMQRTNLPNTRSQDENRLIINYTYVLK